MYRDLNVAVRATGRFLIVWAVTTLVVGFQCVAAEPRFFPTETDSTYVGPDSLDGVDPKHLDKAKSAEESRPADRDPQGNWGLPTEGFQMGLRFEKTTFKVGEPISAVVYVRNLTEKPIEYNGIYHVYERFVVTFDSTKARIIGASAPRDASFKERLKSPRSNIRTLSVKPGWQREHRFILSSEFSMTQPGTYLVYARERVPKPGSVTSRDTVELRSANAVIRIVPGKDPTRVSVK